MSWRHRGPMESATSWTPSQPCGMQMLTSECVTDKCHARGCNLPTAPAQIHQPWCPPGPLRTSLLEIAKPLFLSPRNRKGFRPSVKDSFRSFLFVVTACRNSREASLPEKDATEATSCPKGGNVETLIWTGLGPVQGLTGDPDELTPVLGLASDCSAQSDCRGAWRIPPGFTVRGTELGEKKGARIPGWGGIAQQAWHRPVLPAHYLTNTREETGLTRRL